jgi:Transglutaminase-like superfamily
VPGDASSVRAAVWTAMSLRRARRQLRMGSLDEFSLPAPPRLPAKAVRGVQAVLRRIPQTCLERALVLQCWYAYHGQPRDVVIAVRGSASNFGAHAWLDGEPDGANGYAELLRVPARQLV